MYDRNIPVSLSNLGEKTYKGKKRRPQEKTILFSGIRSHYHNGMNPTKKRGSNKLASYQ